MVPRALLRHNNHKKLEIITLGVIELLSKGATMALGDFTGCFIVLMLFHLDINSLRRHTVPRRMTTP